MFRNEVLAKFLTHYLKNNDVLRFCKMFKWFKNKNEKEI